MRLHSNECCVNVLIYLSHVNRIYSILFWRYYLCSFVEKSHMLIYVPDKYLDPVIYGCKIVPVF
jgi:hypothetical protein